MKQRNGNGVVWTYTKNAVEYDSKDGENLRKERKKTKTYIGGRNLELFKEKSFKV